jgi:hypothetical protein
LPTKADATPSKKVGTRKAAEGVKKEFEARELVESIDGPARI